MAQDLTSKKTNFIKNCTSGAVAFLNAYNSLKQLRAEYASEGYSFSQDDFVDPNLHLTPTIVANLMSTFDVIDSLINSNTQDIDGSVGYLTNLYNMKP